ncbi:hypothetical protein GOODEAATRI_020644, partial [Goodea atripinnis]
GRVRDIIYKGSREQIQQALMPDGKVPLVSGPVFFCRSVSEKLLQTHVSPPLDGCTYLGLDSGAPPLQVFEHSSVSLSSDLALLGPAEVSLLGSNPGSVCGRGQSWLEFPSQSTWASSEDRQSGAVEDP